MRALVAALGLVVAACSPGPAASPSAWWLRDVPDGFTVVYHAEVGEGVCGFPKGCPTRIIQHTGSDSFCVVEIDRDGRWEFREQTRCP